MWTSLAEVFLCFQEPHNPCIIAHKWCSVLVYPVAPPFSSSFLSAPSHVTHHLWSYLPWAWFDQRGKAGEREDLWITYDALPPRNWGITIRILVPLLCYSVPVVKVGYATEQAETKQVFWTGGLCFPQRRRRCLGHRTKKDNKKSTKTTWSAEELANTFAHKVLKETIIYNKK